MFGIQFRKTKQFPFTLGLDAKSYSMASVDEHRRVLFANTRAFKEKNDVLLEKSLAEDVERLKLIGEPCRVILTPGQYQLVLMDAPKVKDDEIAKAIKWQLKGQIDYPLNDIVLYILKVPPHGTGGQRKKIFVAITQRSQLTTRLSLLERVYLDVKSVHISEFSFVKLMSITPHDPQAPIMVVSRTDLSCQIHILFQNELFFVRDLQLTPGLILKDTTTAQGFLLELQRSFDYCQVELKLPELQQVFLTPSFYEEDGLLPYLNKELGKDVHSMDLNTLFTFERPMSMKEQADVFFSLSGSIVSKRDMIDG